MPSSATLVDPKAAQMQAQAELARRELARRRLIYFAQYVNRSYQAAAHHTKVAEALEQVSLFIESKGAQGIGRLLITMPPRHGKTELASKLFPAWLLGQMPWVQVILASYGAKLAIKNSRAVRAYISDRKYEAVFGVRSRLTEPVQIDRENSSAESWGIDGEQGGLTATGVGGAVTGMGAHLLVPDDLFKNRDEAESEARRERVWDWWQSSAYTRLEDGGAIVGMMTRWHPDDWAGRLLKNMTVDPLSDQYVVINLPAISEGDYVPEERDGKLVGFGDHHEKKLQGGVWVDERDQLGRAAGTPLWVEKYDKEDLARIRANIGVYEWTALYQQQPYLRAGDFFRREWFNILENPPKPDEMVAVWRVWDKAGGSKRSKRMDYSVGVLMAKLKDGRYVVLHVARRQIIAAKRNRFMLETGKIDRARAYRVRSWMQEDPATAGTDSANETKRLFAEEGLAIGSEKVTGDKEVRAAPYATMCEAGNVYLVRAAWNDDFVEEHAAFPKGGHDDQVDAGSTAFVKLSKRVRESRIY